VFNLNFIGTLLPTQVFGRYMVERGEGCIINIASMASLKPYPQQAAYCASKGAVSNLTRAMALDWSAEGIRVNAVGVLSDQPESLSDDRRGDG